MAALISQTKDFFKYQYRPGDFLRFVVFYNWRAGHRLFLIVIVGLLKPGHSFNSKRTWMHPNPSCVAFSTSSWQLRQHMGLPDVCGSSRCHRCLSDGRRRFCRQCCCSGGGRYLPRWGNSGYHCRVYFPWLATDHCTPYRRVAKVLGYQYLHKL